MFIPLIFSASEEVAGGPAPQVPYLLGMPEHEFVSRLREGDESAFTTMYRSFFPRLVAVATGYVAEAIAEDLAQDVLLYVWDNRADWKVETGVGTYLYASVRNRALNHLRHEGVVGRLERSVLPDDPSEKPPGMGDSPVASDVRLEMEDVRALVDAALARMADGPRTAFLLRWMHDLSYPEIAKIMSTSEASVRQQVARARRVVVPVLKKVAIG